MNRKQRNAILEDVLGQGFLFFTQEELDADRRAAQARFDAATSIQGKASAQISLLRIDFEESVNNALKEGWVDVHPLVDVYIGHRLGANPSLAEPEVYAVIAKTFTPLKSQEKAMVGILLPKPL